LRDRFTSSLIDLQKIRDLFVAKVSYEASPQFDQLPAFLTGTKELLDSIITQRVPPDISESTSEARGTEENSEDAAAPDRSQDGAALHGEVQTIREASSALHAIVNYYSLAEPSSPARLLVRQAHQLVGKSFVEAMQILAPELVEETRIDITGSLPFSLNFAQLQALAIEDQAAPDEQEEVRSFTVASRQEASELMKAIERCYRKLEPSSPIPLLLERARKFVAKDFATLLREVAKRDDSKDNSFG
jgi:type VI secretion system protein ImpA